MNSDCFVFVEERDEFRMWQGLVGPYYTPAVDSIGNLSWANNGNLVNPPTVNVSGRGLTIVGIVDTAGDLPESAPNYTVYLVGTTSPYHAYIFDGTTWTDLGIVGKGDKGDPGQGVPSGGTTGQVLKKKSATDYDAAWRNDDLGITGASVGDLVRISAVDTNNKPTAFTKVPLNEIKCNRNLLDNWYFVGGGSQLGYGIFPVNQRGQTSYSNAGNTIDRWKTDGSLTVNAGGINTSGTVLYQLLNAGVAKKLLGKTVTASALLADGTLLSGTATFPSGISATSVIAYPGTNNKLRYALINDGSIQILRFQLASTDADIVAAKVEIGSTQTLAHQEGSTWVLNEVPNWSEQFYLCTVAEKSGLLKASANGSVTPAVAGTDYLTPATNYSPVGRAAGDATYTLTVADIGKTFYEKWNSSLPSQTVTYLLTGENSANMPVGTEIAFAYLFSNKTHISLSGVRCYNSEFGLLAEKNTQATVSISSKGSIVALKKFETSSSSGDVWILTGNVEVVT